jgi:outer membrane protein assembly factor BamA
VCALIFWLCSLCLGGPAYAEIPQEWLGERIVEARIAGEQAGRVNDDVIGIERGDELSRGLVRAAIERLLADGRFADVQVDAVLVEGGVGLLFHLTPRLLVKRVEMVGNSALDDRDLGRLIGVREESELAREDFPGWVAEIRKAYAARGYPDAQVRIVLRDMDDITYKVLRLEVSEGKPLRIVEVRFEGETLPHRKGMRRILGFAVGDIADSEKIEEGVRKAEEMLRRQGYYRALLDNARIEVAEGGAHVVIPARVGPAYEVHFTGNEPLGKSELFAKLALNEERIVSEASLRALEQKLSDTYHRYSFQDVEVQIAERLEIRQFAAETTSERWQEEVMVLDVTIEPGEQTEVEAVTFPGASHFDAKFLRSQLYSYLEEDLPGSSLVEPVDSDVVDQLGASGGKGLQQAREVKKPLLLDPRHMYYEASYEQAIEHLRELYRGDGYLDVKIAEPTLTPLTPSAVAAPSDPRTHVVGVIQVDEGPRTFLYDIRVENNKELSNFELLTAAALARGTPFSYLKLEEARLRVVEACQEKGHFFAKVEPDVRLSDDGTRAEVVFRVDEGYVVRISQIEVRGNLHTSRAMILDRVRFKVGDLFRPSLARQSQDSLLFLDVFTSATVAPDEADLPARMKSLVVSVTERKTQWLGWSAGFSTGEGARGGIEYGYRNLFSRAVHASFRGQIGYQFVFLDKEIERQYKSLNTSDRIEYQTTLTFGVPYIPRLPKNTASLDLTALADIQRDYRIEKQAAMLTFIYRPIKGVTLTFSEELETSDFKLLAEHIENENTLPPANFVPDGKNTLLATQLVLALDLRDRAFNPSRGILVSFSPEYDRTLAADASHVAMGMSEDPSQMSGEKFKSNMFRLMGSFAFYIPLAPKLTFASQWRYGRIVHLESDSASYPNRLFYLGGANFRGYYINKVIPQDVRNDKNADLDNLASHGGQTVLASQSELRFPIFGDLYGGLFSDIGNLWSNPKALDLRDLLVVVGAGLRLSTPVASLAFDYGVRVRDLDGHRFNFAGAFQFAFQTF